MDIAQVESNDSRTTAESVPISGIQPENDIETIAVLSFNAVDNHHDANKNMEAEEKEDWRNNVNVSDTHTRYRSQLEDVLGPLLTFGTAILVTSSHH